MDYLDLPVPSGKVSSIRNVAPERGTIKNILSSVTSHGPRAPVLIIQPAISSSHNVMLITAPETTLNEA